jgi:hypothetical protein
MAAKSKKKQPVEELPKVEPPKAEPPPPPVPEPLLTPKEVLFEQMYFFRDKASDMGLRIAEYLKTEGGRGLELVQLYKHMTLLRKELVDIAHKLAPFEHAKLESVEVKSEVEHRFVVRSPPTSPDVGSFMKLVGKPYEVPILTEHTRSVADTSSRASEDVFVESEDRDMYEEDDDL